MELGRFYREKWTALVQEFENECDAVADKMILLDGDIQEFETPFAPTNPAHTDVHRPGFSYENFFFVGDDGGAGARVPGAAEQQAGGPLPPPEPDSAISRALDPEG